MIRAVMHLCSILKSFSEYVFIFSVVYVYVLPFWRNNKRIKQYVTDLQVRWSWRRLL